VDVFDRFEMLFNKRIQQRNIAVSLEVEEDLKILRLFLTKIKLNIEEIFIRDPFKQNSIDGKFMMTKEDFELIKP
jgi:hypothetical protein